MTQYWLTRDSDGDYEVRVEKPIPHMSTTFTRLWWGSEYDLAHVWPFETMFPELSLEYGELTEITITKETINGREGYFISRVPPLAPPERQNGS